MRSESGYTPAAHESWIEPGRVKLKMLSSSTGSPATWSSRSTVAPAASAGMAEARKSEKVKRIVPGTSTAHTLPRYMGCCASDVVGSRTHGRRLLPSALPPPLAAAAAAAALLAAQAAANSSPPLSLSSSSSISDASITSSGAVGAPPVAASGRHSAAAASTSVPPPTLTAASAAAAGVSSIPSSCSRRVYAGSSLRRVAWAGAPSGALPPRKAGVPCMERLDDLRSLSSRAARRRRSRRGRSTHAASSSRRGVANMATAIAAAAAVSAIDSRAAGGGGGENG
eukprot:scaffold62998_cov63-Phaeocystis_antarctica.AAC.4